MKKFEKPSLEMVCFDEADIITASGCPNYHGCLAVCSNDLCNQEN